jgi:DNA repair photolyase
MSRSLPIVGAARGRGAKSNHTGHYEGAQREDFDDGWTEHDGEPARVEDTLLPLRQKTVITRNDSPDVSFDQSINPYIGCSHGCIYCYARPSHAYHGLSPGLDFETQIFFKPDAGRLLEAELSRPRYVPRVIHIGGNTDPYQPAERRLRITRQAIEVLERFEHPFSIITKSALIRRDLDLIGPMARRGLAQPAISVTTLDRRLARAMEPRAAAPEKRIEAIKALADAGAPPLVLFAPCIPGLNDHEMEAVLERAAAAGAWGASYVVLRLPLEIKDLFREWLEAERPDRAARVMSLVRQMRGGKDYDPKWGERMKGDGPIADILRRRWTVATRRLGLDRRFPTLDLSRFRRPAKAGDQMDLF